MEKSKFSKAVQEEDPGDYGKMYEHGRAIMSKSWSGGEKQQ